VTLRHNSRFARFWLASTVSDFGTYLTTVALSVLILVTLNGSAFDQGLVNAARWAPYLLFGLVAGIWVDRFERSTVLIAGDVVRGALLVILCLAAWTGVLAVPALMAIIFAFGSVALLSDAASQSFLPMLVPRAQLTRANARLEQSTAVAQTSGAALAGSLVAIASAPFALLIDAFSYFFSGAVLFSIRQGQRLPVKQVETASATVRERIAEGLRWIYGHVHLAPLALSTHVWFIGFSMVGAIVPALVILELDLGAFGLGLVLGAPGSAGWRAPLPRPGSAANSAPAEQSWRRGWPNRSAWRSWRWRRPSSLPSTAPSRPGWIAERWRTGRSAPGLRWALPFWAS